MVPNLEHSCPTGFCHLQIMWRVVLRSTCYRTWYHIFSFLTVLHDCASCSTVMETEYDSMCCHFGAKFGSLMTFAVRTGVSSAASNGLFSLADDGRVHPSIHIWTHMNRVILFRASRSTVLHETECVQFSCFHFLDH